MSKQMKVAYRAMDMRDATEAVMGSKAFLIVWAVALAIAIATGSVVPKIVGGVFAIVYGLSVAMYCVCSACMKKMGYSEVDIERAAYNA